jgi:GMP synthase (glutamine-hydrolysing)
MSVFVVLQHVECEPPAVYEDVLRERGHEVARVMVADQESLPDLASYAGIVAMGAPQSVTEPEAHAWLSPELDAVATAVRRDTPYWGVCFGAQLLAAALGARVWQGAEPEVGVLDVHGTPAARSDPVFGSMPDRYAAVQWHSDTFDLPDGAVHLAASRAYPAQAFRWWRAYALQFHLEAPADLIAEWLAIPAYARALQATLGPDAGGPFMAAIRAAETRMTSHARELFTRWLDHVALDPGSILRARGTAEVAPGRPASLTASRQEERTKGLEPSTARSAGTHIQRTPESRAPNFSPDDQRLI